MAFGRLEFLCPLRIDVQCRPQHRTRPANGSELPHAQSSADVASRLHHLGNFIGSGPDTFAEVFPQEDYAGKLVYSDRPDMIIEKAHNDYLTKWVQTGGISLICILVFYVLFIRLGWRFFFQKKTAFHAIDTMQRRLGLGCYIACLSYMFTSLFNDSTLQTSPFFWVFAGIALSSMSNRQDSQH